MITIIKILSIKIKIIKARTIVIALVEDIYKRPECKIDNILIMIINLCTVQKNTNKVYYKDKSLLILQVKFYRNH